MTIQELLNLIDNRNKADVLTLQGIEHFNDGNLEEALLALEESSSINPKSIPNLLYHALCCFSQIQSKTEGNPENFLNHENEQHIQDMISNLETVIRLMKSVTFEFRVG